MRKLKPVGKRSLLKGLLRTLGLDRESALPLPSQAEAQVGVLESHTSHTLTGTGLQEAEQARTNAHAQALRDLQRKSTF